MPKKHKYGPYDFKIKNFALIPFDAIGLYAFWYGGKCIYIGQAKDQSVKERLWQHFKRCHNPRLNLWIEAYGRELKFCVFVVHKYQKINFLEKRLIRRHQPTANVLLK